MKRSRGEITHQDYPPGEKPLEYSKLIPVVFDDEEKIGELLKNLGEKVDDLALKFKNFLEKSGWEVLNQDIVLRELGLNAVYHGVLGLGHVKEKDKAAAEKVIESLRQGHKVMGWVSVAFKVFKDKAIVDVVDSGQGFDPSKLDDPTQGDKIMQDNGRGLFIVFSIAGRENVKFSHKGSQITITLIKGRKINGL